MTILSQKDGTLLKHLTQPLVLISPKQYLLTTTVSLPPHPNDGKGSKSQSKLIILST